MVMGNCQTRQPINHRMLLLATIIMAEVQEATSLICSKLAINQGPIACNLKKALAGTLYIESQIVRTPDVL